MSTDKQFDAHLIEDYDSLMQIREAAQKENAVETVKLIDRKIELLKLKLQPLELPRN